MLDLVHSRGCVAHFATDASCATLEIANRVAWRADRKE